MSTSIVPPDSQPKVHIPPTDISNPSIQSSNLLTKQAVADSQYDLQYKTEPPKVLQLGGTDLIIEEEEEEDIVNSRAQTIWMNPKTLDIYTLHWTSPLSKRAEKTHECVETLFYWLPKWTSQVPKQHRIRIQSLKKWLHVTIQEDENIFIH
jgi:hypothetical protein